MKKLYIEPNALFVAVHRNDIITGSSEGLLDETKTFEFYNEGVDAGL